MRSGDSQQQYLRWYCTRRMKLKGRTRRSKAETSGCPEKPARRSVSTNPASRDHLRPPTSFCRSHTPKGGRLVSLWRANPPLPCGANTGEPPAEDMGCKAAAAVCGDSRERPALAAWRQAAQARRLRVGESRRRAAHTATVASLVSPQSLLSQGWRVLMRNAGSLRQSRCK